jgi:flavin-dependent dehydrogenase
MTPNLNRSLSCLWDVAILGAGPAGGFAAAILSKAGRRVLLIERSAWPREKVCGGCLNAVAIRHLTDAGLGAALAGAARVDHVAWHVGNRSLHLAAPGGAAVLRSELDSGIVAAAIERGCTFLPGVSAFLLPAESAVAFRALRLRAGDDEVTVSARAVLACDGIGGTSLAAEPWARWKISRGAWMGVSTTCHGGPMELEPGAIHMHVGQGGYVGLVRLSDERTHLAAALDPAACRRAGGPGPLIETILSSSNCPAPPDLQGAKFRGAGELTRRRDRLGGYRVLAVGDACGYVEPFTGEGMAWAIAGARQAVDLLPAPDAEWPNDLADQWHARHAATIVRRQRWCRGLRPMMHHPALAGAGLRMGRAAPPVGNFLASRIQGGVE